MTHRTCRRILAICPLIHSIFPIGTSKHLDGESNGSANNGHGHAADGTKSSSSVGGGSSRRLGGRAAGAAAGRLGGRGGREDLTAKDSAGGRLGAADLFGSGLELSERLVGVGVDGTNHAGSAVVADGLGAVEPDRGGVVDLDLEDVGLETTVSTRDAVRCL